MYRVVSFDCGNKAMGVAFIEFNTAEGVPTVPTASASLAEQVAAIERYIAALHRYMNGVVRLSGSDVWDLAPDVGGRALAGHEQTICQNLKTRLGGLPRPDGMWYEFQMGINDKSRATSHYLTYNYCDICPVNTVGGALKNTVMLAPHLDHRRYLARYADPYVANKQHCADSLTWWAEMFGVDISHIPAGVRKDAGDAFMQVLALLKHGRLVKQSATPKVENSKTKKSTARRPRAAKRDLDIG